MGELALARPIGFRSNRATGSGSAFSGARAVTRSAYKSATEPASKATHSHTGLESEILQNKTHCR
jgi:predicted outer membrane repeat protein